VTARGSLAGVLVVGVILYFVPSFGSTLGLQTQDILFLYSLLFWITQATAWNIFSGYSGYFNFGQSAFYGVGLYASVILVQDHGVNFFLSIPLAGVITALIAGVIAIFVFRLREVAGLLFALLTVVLTFVGMSVAQVSRSIDGGRGRTVSIPHYPHFLGDYASFIYRLGVVMAVVAVCLSIAVYYSKFGWGLFAIRDQEAVAEGLGVPTLRYKLLAFALSCGLVGASSAIHAVQLSYFQPTDVFDLGGVAIAVVFMCIVGGRGHWLGPIIGAIVIYTATSRLVQSNLATWNDIIRGVGLAVVMVIARDGIVGQLRSHPIWAGTVFVSGSLLGALAGVGGAINRIAVGLVVMLVALLVQEAIGSRFRWPVHIRQWIGGIAR
jgi:branched-chain amino acid transport system permease protein